MQKLKEGLGVYERGGEIGRFCVWEVKQILEVLLRFGRRPPCSRVFKVMHFDSCSLSVGIEF